jgi:hypothetical protein
MAVLESMTFDNHLLRMLGKPTTFSGDQNARRDWRFIFESHIMAVSVELHEEMMAAAHMTHLPIVLDDMGEECKLCCRSLYTILSTLWTGDALLFPKTVPTGNGLQAWREMVKRCEAGLPGRQLGLL